MLRTLALFPLYMKKGAGACLWDVDNNKFVDTVLGNGALFFGHSNPIILEAMESQLRRGTHLGSCTLQELQLARLITQMIPSADRVRFTMTGSEATQLALRLARAYTGHSRYVRFSGHFHGWHDGVAVGSNIGQPGADSCGIPDRVSELAIVCDVYDRDQINQSLNNDVAAVILEPSGGKAGLNTLPKDFLHWLRKVTLERNILLIFDEVVTGFRWSSGESGMLTN